MDNTQSAFATNASVGSGERPELTTTGNTPSSGVREAGEQRARPVCRAANLEADGATNAAKKEVFSVELRINEGIAERSAEFVRITALGRRPLPTDLLQSLGLKVAEMSADLVGDYVGANNITIEASRHIDSELLKAQTQRKG